MDCSVRFASCNDGPENGIRQRDGAPKAQRSGANAVETPASSHSVSQWQPLLGSTATSYLWTILHDRMTRKVELC